jgi:hypothetical protein
MYFFPPLFRHIFTSLPCIKEFALGMNCFQFISAPKKNGYRETNGKLQNLSESCLCGAEVKDTYQGSRLGFAPTQAEQKT